MKPYVYSEKGNKLYNTGWSQEGENISYIGYFSQQITSDIIYNNQKYLNTLIIFIIYIIRKKKFYKLSFTYTFEHDNDSVYFATCIPYTYSELLKFIKTLRIEQDSLPEGFNF